MTVPHHNEHPVTMYHASDAARRLQRTPGQLRTRVEELKNPWRPSTPLTLSHNESARLATDALLEHGEDAYLKALVDEKELPFLSSVDIEYVRSNATVQNGDSLHPAASEELPDEDCLSEQTSGTYFPLMSDIDVPMLELGWPEIPAITKHSPTEVTVHFQRDRSNSIKDLLRSVINKAKLVIAIVMDLFTDADILCDLVAAATKRRVPVYLLLDEKNLGYFIEMWEKLDLKSIKVPNLKVRTLTGSTYCTKSGKKFSGQFLEKFILVDCEQVIAGTYSFSWISSQVHSHLVTLFVGKIVEDFDTEFRCLYANSNVVDYFHTEELGSGPYSRSANWNTQPYLRSVLSNGSGSQSTSSKSSLKASPYATSTIYKALHEDKQISSSYIDSEKRNANGGLNGNILSHNRRQSSPTDSTVGVRGRSNLGVVTSLFSKSTPTLNQFEPVPHFNHPTIAEVDIVQPENKRPTDMKTDRLSNSSTRACHLDGEKNGTCDPAGPEFNNQNGKLSRNDNRNTLGHSNLDMMMKYRRGPNGVTRGLHADNHTSTTVKSNLTGAQADAENHTVSQNGTKNQSTNLNEDVNRRTLGHSKLDMMAKYRPQPTSIHLAEHKPSTMLNGETSLNHFNDADSTECKKDLSAKLNGLKADLRKLQNGLGSDENTRTLGHSRLDMITNGRPPTTTVMSVLQPEYKTTSATVKNDSSCNVSDVSRSESKENNFSAPLPPRDLSKDSKNLIKNDKRMTLGHSKLDMITSTTKAQPKQAYSRFTPAK